MFFKMISLIWRSEQWITFFVSGIPAGESRKFELSLFADVGRTGIIDVTGKVFSTDAGGDFFGMNTCKISKYQSLTVIGASN